jgi:hypothetical protein
MFSFVAMGLPGEASLGKSIEQLACGGDLVVVFWHQEIFDGHPM